MTITTPPEDSCFDPAERFPEHRSKQLKEAKDRYFAKWGKEIRKYHQFTHRHCQGLVLPPLRDGDFPLPIFPSLDALPSTKKFDLQEYLAAHLLTIQREIDAGNRTFAQEVIPFIPTLFREIDRQEDTESLETKRLYVKANEIIRDMGEPDGSQKSLGVVYSHICRVEKGWFDLGDRFNFVKAADHRANFLRAMGYYLIALHLLEYLACVLHDLDRGDSRAVKPLRFINTLWRLRLIATYLKQPDRAMGLMADLRQLAIEINTDITWAEYWRTLGTCLTSQYEYGGRCPDLAEIDFCFQQAKKFLKPDQLTNHEMRLRAELESLSAWDRKDEAIPVVEEYVKLYNFRLNKHSLRRIQPLAERHGYKIFLQRNKFSTYAAFNVPYHNQEETLASVPLLS